MPHSTMGREGDSIVSRSEAGEDARVEIELTITAPRPRCVVVVGQEGVKGDSLWRFECTECTTLPHRYQNDRLVRVLLE